MTSDQVLEMPALDGLIGRLQAVKPALNERYGVESIGIFGSYVRGEAEPESDLDVLVEFSTPPSLFQFVRMTGKRPGRAGRVLHAPLPVPVRANEGRIERTPGRSG